MKVRIVICTLVLMFSAFAGSVFGGTEGPYSTAYGLGAGYNASYHANTFIGTSAGSNNAAWFNTFVGVEAGVANTTGATNTFIGYHAGHANIDGGRNTFVGLDAGTTNTSGAYNVFMGNQSGWTSNTGGNNTFIGDSAGKYNTTGNSNTYLGQSAGYNSNGSNNTFVGVLTGTANTADNNTFIGYQAGQANTADNNTFIGYQAGQANVGSPGNTYLGSYAGGQATGSNNTFLGYYAGGQGTGSNNTYVGFEAGYTNSGSNNVFLGFGAGFYEGNSNKLYIDGTGTGTSTPLIYGEFDNSIVGINGKLGVGTQAPVRGVHLSGSNAVFRMDRTADTAAFQIVRTDISGNPMKVFVVGVNSSGTGTGEFIINDNGTQLSGSLNRRMTIANDGTVTFPGDVYMHAHYNTSSITLKDHVRTYENALDTVNRLRGVSFDWKDSGKPAVGLIAEEVAKVVPEVVAYNDGAAAGVNYASLVGVLVEAVKEQQAIVKELQDKNNRLEQRLLVLEGK